MDTDKRVVTPILIWVAKLETSHIFQSNNKIYVMLPSLISAHCRVGQLLAKRLFSIYPR